MSASRSVAFLVCGIAAFTCEQSSARAAEFRFDRETLGFVNTTVFEYREGSASGGKKPAENGTKKPYTRRCFVMSRTALQFYKFARFDSRGAPLDDKTLAARIRQVTRKGPWHPALPENERVLFPGYADLRAMSKARAGVLQENIGLGWPTYLRLGNARMFYRHDEKYQEQTQANLEAALARGDLFVAYLSDYPYFNINHTILVYARRPGHQKNGIVHYLAYDPNHPDAPRVLRWAPDARVFNYPKDEEFVGGFVRVYQVYGKPLQ